MSKKETREGKEERKGIRKEIPVKNVHYGTKRLVDCMKAVIQANRNRDLSAAGGEYGQEW